MLICSIDCEQAVHKERKHFCRPLTKRSNPQLWNLVFFHIFSLRDVIYFLKKTMHIICSLLRYILTQKEVSWRASMQQLLMHSRSRIRLSLLVLFPTWRLWRIPKNPLTTKPKSAEKIFIWIFSWILGWEFFFLIWWYCLMKFILFHFSLAVKGWMNFESSLGK